MSTPAIHIKLESIIRSALAAADSSAEAGNLERATAALSLARDAQELYAASGPPSLQERRPKAPSEGEWVWNPDHGGQWMPAQPEEAADSPRSKAPVVRMEIVFGDPSYGDIGRVAGAATEFGTKIRIDAGSYGAAFVHELNELYNLDVGVLPKGGAS